MGSETALKVEKTENIILTGKKETFFQNWVVFLRENRWADFVPPDFVPPDVVSPDFIPPGH